jgi:hypothetical protein
MQCSRFLTGPAIPVLLTASIDPVRKLPFFAFFASVFLFPVFGAGAGGGLLIAVFAFSQFFIAAEVRRVKGDWGRVFVLTLAGGIACLFLGMLCGPLLLRMIGR